MKRIKAHSQESEKAVKNSVRKGAVAHLTDLFSAMCNAGINLCQIPLLDRGRPNKVSMTVEEERR